MVVVDSATFHSNRNEWVQFFNTFVTHQVEVPVGNRAFTLQQFQHIRPLLPVQFSANCRYF